MWYERGPSKWVKLSAITQRAVSSTGLNEREAPGKITTARPALHLAQLRSISHAHV